MKNIFFAGLLACLAAACTQPIPVPQPAAVPPTVAAPQIDSNATYVINDFLVAVAQTKSPYAVSKTADYPLFGFSFTPTKLRGYTVHEGGYDADLRFDAATHKYIGQGIPGLEPFELSMAANGDVVLAFLTSKKTYTYKKVPDADSALREVLFAGKYTDAKAKTTVTFQTDGILIGLGADKTYQVVYDFLGGPLDFDEIVVREKADESKVTYYHYKFKGDTLELYEVLPSSESPDGKVGKLRYTLVRE